MNFGVDIWYGSCLIMNSYWFTMVPFIRWELHFQWFTYLELLSCLWAVDSLILTSRSSMSNQLWRLSLNEGTKWFIFPCNPVYLSCLFLLNDELVNPRWSHYLVRKKTMWLWLLRQFGLFSLRNLLFFLISKC